MKLKEAKKFILIGSITLITALVWVALDSYHQLVRQEQLEKVSDLIEPLDPHLNTEVLDQIEARKEYQVNEVEKFLLPTATPTPASSLEENLAGEISTSSGVTTESGIRQ